MVLIVLIIALAYARRKRNADRLTMPNPEAGPTTFRNPVFLPALGYEEPVSTDYDTPSFPGGLPGGIATYDLGADAPIPNSALYDQATLAQSSRSPSVRYDNPKGDRDAGYFDTVPYDEDA